MRNVKTAPYSFHDIERAVCSFFPIESSELRSPDRSRRTARPRFVLVYLARERTRLSLPMIGDKLHRDHTTILNAERRAKELISQDADFASSVLAVSNILDQATPEPHRVRASMLRYPLPPPRVPADLSATWV